MAARDEADKRLDDALAKLESALQVRAAAAQKDAEAGNANAATERELTVLRADYAGLKETSGLVSQRLDDAIGRLKNMLAD